MQWTSGFLLASFLFYMDYSVLYSIALYNSAVVYYYVVHGVSKQAIAKNNKFKNAN